MIHQDTLIEEFWRKNLDQILPSNDDDQITQNIKCSLSVYFKNSEKSFYTNSDLNMISSYSFFLTGYEDKALKLLLKDQYYRSKARCWINNFHRINNFNQLFPFISNGLVSSDYFSGAKNKTMLVLNLSNLLIKDEEFHEILIYHLLNSFINHLCYCWDFNQNNTILAIKGLRSQKLRRIFSCGGSPHANELYEYIKNVFNKNRDKFSWKYQPELLVF